MAKKTKTGSITIDRELCKGCYMCMSVCPNHLIAISEELNQKGYYPAVFTEMGHNKEERKCTGCTTCAIICPDVAIEVYRESKTID
jgi:2-oxoglutarate ferredoxin oxidoreductase subunit delta